VQNTDFAAAETTASVQPQQLGDFQILREIGRGGMGIVYEANQLSIDRRVALKILPSLTTLNEKRLERFKNEVRAAASLDHPNCVPVYAVGDEHGVHYFAMKLIRGQSLAEVISELQNRDTTKRGIGSPLLVNGHSESNQNDWRAGSSCATETVVAKEASVELLSVTSSSNKRVYFRRVAELGVQVAGALHHAHEHGVVHRDIKPGNLLLDTSGKIWVADFGLAYIEADVRVSMTGDFLGTLRYMAPEQALGKRALADHRVDVYSLGATLYELLSLRPAIQGESQAEMLRFFSDSEPIPLRKIKSSIPAELETIIGKAMERSPVDRYTTSGELADDLNRFLANKPILAKRSSITERTLKWVRRYPILASLMAVLAFALASIAGLSLRHAYDLSQLNTQLIDSLSQSEQLRDTAVKQRSHMKRAKYLLDMRLANSSLNEGHSSEASKLLEQYLPPSPDAAERDFPWYYLWGERQELLKIYRGHAGSVTSSIIAKNAGLVISASQDKTVRFFDLHDQKELVRTTGFAGNVNALALTPDEQVLFTGADGGELFAWDISTVSDGDQPKKIGSLKAHTEDVFALKVSPNGNRLASAGADGRVLIWELPTLRQINSLEGHTGWVRCLDYSPDGATLASISHDNYLILWDLEEATEKQRIEIAEGEQLGLSVCFHPGGQYLATGNSHGEVRLIRLDDYETVSVFEGNIGWFRSLDFSDSGNILAAAGSEPFIRLLHINRNMRMKLWHTLPSRQKNTYCVRFVDGRHSLLSSGTDGTTTLRYIRDLEKDTIYNFPYLDENPRLDREYTTRRLSISRGGDKVFLAGRQRGKLFDIGDLWNPTEIIVSNKGNTTGGAIAADGQWVGSLQGQSIKFTATKQPHKSWTLLADSVDSELPQFSVLAFHPSRNVVAAGTGSGQLSVVKMPSGEKLAEFEPFKDARITDVAYTTDGRFVAGCFCNLYESEPASVVVWDATSFAEVTRIESVNRLLAVSPQGCRLAMVNQFQSILIWNIETQTLDTTLTGHSSSIISGDFSPDGKYLLTTAKSGPIKLWSTDSGQLVLNMASETHLHQAVFTSNRSAVATVIRSVQINGKEDYEYELIPLLEKHSLVEPQ
jgi:WD40 repeat protein